MKILALNGNIGYGYSEEAFENALKQDIACIGGDNGTTDAGPYYLGSGSSLTDRVKVKRDIELSLPVALKRRIPYILGSAGTAGGDIHVQWVKDIIEEIAKEKGLYFKMAVIHSEVSKEYLRKKLREGKVKSLGPPQLTEEDIDASVRLVGQIGVTPFIKALDKGVDVILAGRACDTAIYAAVPIREGCNPGLAWHMAKIMECGAFCSEPGSPSDCMVGDIQKDHFILEPPNPMRRCTCVKVAAHTLYEQPDPYYIYEPDGMMDLKQCKYEQYTERAVKVSGSNYVSAEKPTIKIEGVRLTGYRTIAIGATRDALMIQNIDEILNTVRGLAADQFKGKIGPEDYHMDFRVYGKKGVMGELEPSNILPNELLIIVDIVAKTQEIAISVCSGTRALLLHFDYAGRKVTRGNLAFPYSPSDVSMGAVYEFHVYHTVEVDDLCETTSTEVIEVGG